MIVDIGSGQDGWTKYGLGENGDRPGAVLIRGDTELGDMICNSTDYNTGQYIRMVISYADDLPTEKADQITKEFFTLFMGGHREDEYHLDLIRHDDSDYVHHHARIPKLNLYTGNQLKIYNHKTDVNRINAIRDYLVKKHGLTHPEDQRKLVKQPKKDQLERIAKWRAEHSQPVLILKTKKGRIAAEEALDNYITELIQFNEIRTFEDLKKEISGIAEIVNEGYEQNKKVPFLTIQQGDKKLKITGDIYGRSFYDHTRQDREKAVRENKPIKESKFLDGVSIEELKKRVVAAQTKRKKFLDGAYASARARAEAQEDELIPQEITKEEKTLLREIIQPERKDNDTIREQIDRDAETTERSYTDLIEESKRRIQVNDSRSAAVAVLTDGNTGGIGEERRRREQRRSVRESLVSVLVEATGRIEGIIRGVIEAIKPVVAPVPDPIPKEEEYQQPEISTVLDQDNEDPFLPGDDAGINSWIL